MPATAGRVRMPANNRVHSSAALQTHGIWQSAIGYDPYAPEKDSKEKSSGGKPEADGRAENAYASFQGLLALARITGSSANDTRGACKKCGRIGHLTYQCRNFLSVKEDKEKDEATLQHATVVFDKIKKASGMKNEEKESSEEEEEDSDSLDSDADSEIERIIAARSGKNRKKVDKDDGSKEKKRERRGRSKKRSGKRGRRGYDDDDDGDKEDDAKRKEKRHRRRYASSDEDSSEEERGRKAKKLRKRRHAGSDDDGSDEDNRHRHHRKSRKERKRSHH